MSVPIELTFDEQGTMVGGQAYYRRDLLLDATALAEARNKMLALVDGYVERDGRPLALAKLYVACAIEAHSQEAGLTDCATFLRVCADAVETAIAKPN